MGKTVAVTMQMPRADLTDAGEYSTHPSNTCCYDAMLTRQLAKADLLFYDC